MPQTPARPTAMDFLAYVTGCADLHRTERVGPKSDAATLGFTAGWRKRDLSLEMQTSCFLLPSCFVYHNIPRNCPNRHAPGSESTPLTAAAFYASRHPAAPGWVLRTCTSCGTHSSPPPSPSSCSTNISSKQPNSPSSGGAAGTSPRLDLGRQASSRRNGSSSPASIWAASSASAAAATWALRRRWSLSALRCATRACWVRTRPSARERGAASESGEPNPAKAVDQDVAKGQYPVVVG